MMFIEKILKQIVHDIGTLKDEVGSLNTTVIKMRDEHGRIGKLGNVSVGA